MFNLREFIKFLKNPFKYEKDKMHKDIAEQNKFEYLDYWTGARFVRTKNPNKGYKENGLVGYFNVNTKHWEPVIE